MMMQHKKLLYNTFVLYSKIFPVMNRESFWHMNREASMNDNARVRSIHARTESTQKVLYCTSIAEVRASASRKLF